MKLRDILMVIRSVKYNYYNEAIPNPQKVWPFFVCSLLDMSVYYNRIFNFDSSKI